MTDETVFDEIPEPELSPPPPEGTVVPALQLKNVGKSFGSVIALRDISLHVDPGTVTCVLGDNGAGKSTLIKTLSGVHMPDKGTLAVDGNPVVFSSPRDALDAGVATVYQDLAIMPLMSVTRNFFLGNEPTKGAGPFKRFDLPRAAGTRLQIGASLVLEITCECDPCARMDALHEGLRAAMTPDWRGGFLARVEQDGAVAVNDQIRIL